MRRKTAAVRSFITLGSLLGLAGLSVYEGNPLLLALAGSVTLLHIVRGLRRLMS